MKSGHFNVLTTVRVFRNVLRPSGLEYAALILKGAVDRHHE
jgi:hypothetical protein